MDIPDNNSETVDIDLIFPQEKFQGNNPVEKI